MKKKVFFPIIIGCVAICLGILFSISKESKQNFSDLTLENVEALTQTEPQGNKKDCVLSLKYNCTSGHKDHIGYRTAN